MTPRVLVADDDAMARESLAELLQEMGFEVVAAAADGQEAVRQAEVHEPDVVLMDARMPNMDGIEATRRIKARAPDVQVIMLSAYDEPVLRSGADEAGTYCYLVKGCGADLIAEMVRRAGDFGRAQGGSDRP